MFIDIVGSTEMTARLGDSAALELVRAHDALVRRGLEAYGRREIKHTGDGIMASFDKAQNSVRVAADIQRRFAAYNADASETLSVRIGIDAGEPVEDHNDLFGSTVQLASRLCSEAEANGIIVSGFARDLCREEDAARFVALGERRFKGLADKAQVFRLEWRDDAPIASNEAKFHNHSGRRAKIKEERLSRRVRTLPFAQSAKLARQAPPETVAYTVMLSPDFSRPDALASSTSIPARDESPEPHVSATLSVFSAGSGHNSPLRSSLVVVIRPTMTPRRLFRQFGG